MISYSVSSVADVTWKPGSSSLTLQEKTRRINQLRPLSTSAGEQKEAQHSSEMLHFAQIFRNSVSVYRLLVIQLLRH